MLGIRHLQRRDGLFIKRRVLLTLFALPYAIILVAFSDKNQTVICLFPIMSIY